MGEPLSDAALDQLYRAARSYDGYLDKPVSEVQLRAIYELLKMGPTSANCQPLRIVWCVSDEAKAKLAACAGSKNAPKILAAPVTAILATDMAFYEKLPELFPAADARSWFTSSPALAEATAIRNGTLQGGYFILATRALGLDTGPMSGFTNAKVDEVFFAGTTIKSNFISTLGYGDPASLSERPPRPAFEGMNSIA